MNAKVVALLLGVGLVVGALTTWLLSARQLTEDERDWLAQRAAVTAQRKADAQAVAAARQEQARADSAAAASLARANANADTVARLRVTGDKLAGQLAKAGTARDSLTLALRLVAVRDSQLAKATDTERDLRATIAEQGRKQMATASELASVTEDRDRLRDLVDAAPVGKHPPRLFGVLPMPKCGPGGAVVLSGGTVYGGLGAACIIPL